MKYRVDEVVVAEERELDWAHAVEIDTDLGGPRSYVKTVNRRCEKYSQMSFASNVVDW